MCGIGGCVLARGGQPNRETLAAMAAALRHRGPDSSGVEVVDNVGLVHTRLAIVDPTAAGAQPMSDPAGEWMLTYNGEVFNHAELRDRLPGLDYRGGSDTETLLHALRVWGDAAIARCNGLFAFAALDRLAGRLLLVRDRFGVKPLYYAPRTDGLWFASEIGILLAAGVERRPRADVLLHTLDHGWANGPLTGVEGVFRVLPGHAIEVDLATLERREWRWYDPATAVDPDRASALARLRPAAAADEVEAALRRSVELRLMADVPVGTMCSGGLDSSLITAFAADAHPRIVAFNAAVTDQPDADESRWATEAASALGVDLVTAPMDARSWRADLVDVVRHVEYPLNHESSVAMWQIGELARSRGVKVLLSGEGADELFGGYDWLASTLRADYAARSRPLESALRTLARRSPRLRDALRRLRDRPPLRGQPLVAAPSDEVLAYERGVEAAARAAYGGRGQSSGRDYEAHLLSLLSLYLPHLLNRQDKATMKASVETREPFLDPDLVALALNLPLELRVEPRPKTILREIGRRHLPASIPDRGKAGFGWDYERYLLPAARPEFLAEGALRELHGASRGEWATITAAPGVWQLPLWTAEIWLRALIEGQSSARIEAELWRDDSRN